MASMRLASWKVAKYMLSLNQASTSRIIRRTHAWLRSAASASCCNRVFLGHGIRLRSQADTVPCDCPAEESEHPCSDVSHKENSLYIDCMLLHRGVSKDCHHGTGNEKPSTLLSWIDVSATVCTVPRCLHRHGCSEPSVWTKRQKNFHCTRDAVCVTCDDKVLCKLCQKSLPVTAFDPDKLLQWQKNFHCTRDAVCITCEPLV